MNYSSGTARKLTAGPHESVSHLMSWSFLLMASNSIENTATPSLSSRRFSSCHPDSISSQNKVDGVALDNVSPLLLWLWLWLLVVVMVMMVLLFVRGKG